MGYYRWFRLVTLIMVLFVALTGCSAISDVSQPTPRPTATIAPFFSGGLQQLPSVDIPTPLPRPTVALDPNRTPVTSDGERPRDSLDGLVEEIPIFDERLAAGWSSEHSFNQLINLQSRVSAASGLTSLEAVPLKPFGGVMLTMSPESRALWPRSEVLGIRFDVSGGSRPLAPHNLIVKALGSNRYAYHVENDNSVPRPDWLSADKPIFDEVGLDRLGLLRDLEAGEWAEVTLWLDEYDQVDYRFVTGLVVFNDELYMRPFYVDNVRLLVRRR